MYGLWSHGKSWTPGWSDSRPVLLLDQTTDQKVEEAVWSYWKGHFEIGCLVLFVAKSFSLQSDGVHGSHAGHHSMSCSWHHSLYKPCSPILHTGALLRSVAIRSVISETETANHLGPQIILSEIKHRKWDKAT